MSCMWCGLVLSVVMCVGLLCIVFVSCVSGVCVNVCIVYVDMMYYVVIIVYVCVGVLK